MKTTENTLNLFLEWIGTVMAVSAAILLAINIPISGWAYVFYLVSSVLLMWWGFRRKAYGIAMQNVVFIVINIIGIYRWLIIA
ncbi:MAG: Unknown protein [uncultured Thiotrichaceae bacterium]|uniref:Nicotinamide riboside transporter PnuC n=1 Tax=uncultured Thiotrichaceae bacterium TaxID=298394 RepID=A0A6S6U117_9GAMM|nr:MAG: Unknown protein [uncultured Thiotrichaceae bacterium]